MGDDLTTAITTCGVGVSRWAGGVSGIKVEAQAVRQNKIMPNGSALNGVSRLLRNAAEGRGFVCDWSTLRLRGGTAPPLRSECSRGGFFTALQLALA